MDELIMLIMKEIEVKILGIDKAEVERKLSELGAEKVYDGILKTTFWDYPDERIRKRGELLRLRYYSDEKIRLVYKGNRRIEDGCKVVDEDEVAVADFEATRAILRKAGFEEKVYHEKKRIRYVLDGTFFEIDEYPGTPVFMEIEAESAVKVDEGIRLLGLQDLERSTETVTELFARLYPGREFNELRF